MGGWAGKVSGVVDIRGKIARGKCCVRFVCGVFLAGVRANVCGRASPDFVTLPV